MDSLKKDEKPTFRQAKRPEAEAPKYWNIKYQEWLSLDEVLYLNMRKANGTSEQ